VKIAALLAVMCVGLLLWRVRTVIVAPVRRLLDTSHALARGDFKASYPSIGTDDEIDELADSFQNAVHRLKSRLVQEEKTRSLFQQFIPASVGAQALGRDPDAVMKGNRHAVTVMVINIRNFKLLMSNLDPDKTVATLNEFFAATNKVITDHHGMTSKYLGDTVMAFFGMPVSGENHCLNAVKAALELPKALQDIYVRLDENYGWELGIGVGISTGEPIVGQFGSSEHFEYTVLGDVVRDAHRLEEVTKGIPEEDSFIISEAVYREVMSQVQVFDLGEKALRDGSSIRAFAVQGLRVEMKNAVRA
jgi:class 3 adenylate cyclase